MGAVRLGRRQRRTKALKELQGRLPPGLWDSVADLNPAERPTMSGLLKAWRRLGRVASISAPDRNLLRAAFVDAFTRVLREQGKNTFGPADFGVSNVRELADLFVTMLDRVGYTRASRAKLRRMRSHLVGELLEVLVRNSRELQPGLRLMAQAQLANFRRPGVGLVDARGKDVVTPASFGAVTTGIDLAVTGPRRSRRKFVDLVHVSVGEFPDGKTFLAILVETEIKMPRAAQKAGKQIGRAQVRFHLRRGDSLSVDVAGHGPLEFKADQILFLPGKVQRNLITVADTPNFTLRTTRAGGYDEAFWEVALDVRADALRRLVDMAVP
ncbi:hypothetical protein STRCI_000181 [Streptomyces cinnabarinus]|uniref:Uncharacterized protein n=1 Tax=Streptomyces cinnabarinus TaxID=67287 RepID=A0ABY7K481_9ACTN|nr:hypothetical protein [Streptomyces cinnabarinus]WAZ19149.1 hypothetical protein STRCI_000181 [Streptomyces cinnabarinus]